MNTIIVITIQYHQCCESKTIKKRKLKPETATLHCQSLFLYSNNIKKPESSLLPTHLLFLYSHNINKPLSEL